MTDLSMHMTVEALGARIARAQFEDARQRMLRAWSALCSVSPADHGLCHDEANGTACAMRQCAEAQR